ncbi:MAG: tetratricopeptide repeat protein [Firmicutes bacterium]|nr:tetratricopeptide repeat protein [Bacillota bacterium]
MTCAKGGCAENGTKDMFCIKCGEKLPDEANFCLKCGTKVVLPEGMNEASQKASQKAENRKKIKFNNKCESCGAATKRLSASHFLCEYCGSEYFLNDDMECYDFTITDEEIMNVFIQAAKFELKNKSVEELQCLLTVKEKAEDNVAYLVKLGRAYRRNDMFDKAMECYEKAELINPNYANIYVNQGTIYIKPDQYAKAESYCKSPFSR